MKRFFSSAIPVTIASVAFAATAAVAIVSWRRKKQLTRPIELNSASAEELQRLDGIDSELAERIIESRPYRNKLELIERMVIPDDIYRRIRHRLFTSVHLDEKSPSVLTSSGEAVA